MPHPGTTAREHPNRPAFIMGGSGEVVTYKQLDERSNQGAHLFRSLGLRPGDSICIMMGNNARFLEIVWAAQRSGLGFTPINPHIDKLSAAYILKNSRARLFIGSREHADAAEEILCEPCNVDHYYTVNGTWAGFRSWEDECIEQPETPIGDECNGLPMLYSSGITGHPKGIAITPRDTDVNTPPILTPYLASTFDFNDATILLSPAPLHHSASLHFNMMNTYQGGTAVIMEKFEPEHALRLMERHRVTHSIFVPIMFNRMLELPVVLRESYDVSALRVAIHGAAPCPKDVKQQMIDWWGDALIEFYSASEGIGMTMIDADDWLCHQGSVGKALVGDIHIVDEEGLELPPGETGTVYFSGEHIRFNYHDEPTMTSNVFNDKGWATARDMGHLDEDGFLYLADRESFAIVSGGITIYPQELENILSSHDKVADVAVFGVPSENLGEEIKAVVEPTAWSEANDETADEILAWLSEKVSWFQMPRSLDFHPNLPRSENGKMYKRALADEHDQDVRQTAQN